MEGDNESSRCLKKGEPKFKVSNDNNNNNSFVNNLHRCQMIDLRRELEQRRQKTQTTITIANQQRPTTITSVKKSNQINGQHSIRANSSASISGQGNQNVPTNQCLVELRLKPARDSKVPSSLLLDRRSCQHYDQQGPLFDQQMAASIKQIELGCSKSLRQINIVGQLNHSACKGTLMMVNNMITVTVMMLVLLSAINETPVDGLALWPFNGASSSSSSSSLFQSNSSLVGAASRHLQTSKRAARDSMGSASQPRPSMASEPDDGEGHASNFVQHPQPAPITKQFHYFWNHDQIEPKTVSEEAQKILGEAQLQTDQLLLSSAMGRSARGDLHQSPLAVPPSPPQGSPVQSVSPLITSRQDTHTTASHMSHQPLAPGVAQANQSNPPASDQEQQVASGSEHQMSVAVSPAIQQQLTSMVLQMQRQQDMSMMMQPRFGFGPAGAFAPMAAVAAAAARRNSAPAMLNPMSRLWMAAGSNQHPVIAPPPSPMGPMSAAVSVQSATMGAPFAAPGMMQARASMAGVPIYGPFMVAPSVNRNALMGSHFMTQPMASDSNQHGSSPGSSSAGASSAANNKQSSSSRLASSFLGRRRSWPLFSFGSGSSSSSASSASGGDKSTSTHLSSAASQFRPSVALPPAAAAARALALTLPPESLALIDMASNQLASAILGQMQARSAAAAAASASANHNYGSSAFADQPMSSDQMQGSGSIPSVQFVSARHSQTGANNAQVPDQSFNLDNVNFNTKQSMNLQPPYLLQSTASPSQALTPATMSLANTFLTYPSQNFDLYSSLIGPSGANLNGTIPFGSRLKRRHLSTSAPQKKVSHYHQQAPYAVKSLQSPAKRALEEQLADETVLRPTHVAYKNETLDRRQSRSMAAPDQKVAKTKSVKRDSSSMNSDLVGSSNKRPQVKMTTEAQNMRQLLMIVATESPVSAAAKSTAAAVSTLHSQTKQQPQQINIDARALANLFETDESAQPGQVRRLKRSIKVFSNIGKQSSGWKSMDSLAKASEREELAKPADDTKSMAGEFESKRSTGAGSGSSSTATSTTSANNGWLVSPGPSSSSSSSPSTSSWLPKSTKSLKPSMASLAASTVAPMLRRQAELTTSPGSGSKQTSEQEAKPSMAAAADTHRQDRSLKIKRITASSASVMHHPAKSSSEQSTGASGKRSAMRVMSSSLFAPMQAGSESKASDSSQQTDLPTATTQTSGSQTSNANHQTSSSSTSSSAQTPAPDVMMASLSESARVVNYFANVDNDPVTSTTTRPPVISSNSNLQASGQSQPLINVGFPPPTKTSNTQLQALASPPAPNSQQQQQTSSNSNNNIVTGRLNDTQQPPMLAQTNNNNNNNQNMGNAAAYGPRSSTSGIGNANDFQTNGNQQQQLQSLATAAVRQQQAQNRQQLQVNAGNADISSAATGTQAFAVKSIGIPTSGNFARQQTEASSPISMKLQSPFSANLLTTLLGLDPTQRSSSPTGTIVPNIASSLNANGANRNNNHQHHHHNHQRSSPSSSNNNNNGNSNKQQASSSLPSSLSQMERSPSADQSNNFNEELLPPQFMMNDNSNNQQQQQQRQQIHYGLQQQADSSLANQDLMNANQMGNNEVANQMAAGMPPGFSDNNFGIRNSAQNQQQQQQQQQLDASNDQQQGLDLSRFNQQQVNQMAQQQLFGSSPFNASDQFGISADMSPPPAVPQDSSNLYGPSGSGSTQQQQAFALSTTSPGLQLSNSQQAPAQFQQQAAQQPADASQLIGPSASGLNWQQLQALGAAVSNYNQQRFNQLEDAMRMESLQTQQSAGGHRAGFDRPSLMGAGGHQQIEPMASSLAAPSPLSLQQQQHGHPPFGAIDEDAAAGAAAAAGIPSYPNAAQLMAMQAHAHQLPSHSGAMLMASTENREADDGDSDSKPAKKKGGKKKGGSKQAVSHHYHFNSLGSPFEDADGQLNPMSPLDLVAGLQASEQAQANREAAKQKAKIKQQQEKEEEEQQEKEAEKPKKKGFLRRFSIKNLFKRFKKDKKKENQNQTSEEQNDSSNPQTSSNEK